MTHLLFLHGLGGGHHAWDAQLEHFPRLGYAGLCDAIVARMTRELDGEARVIATGGLAPLIAKESQTIAATDEMLTMQGLRIIFERNR